jgi:uncharacterized protein YjbI with pentapeptide repeats
LSGLDFRGRNLTGAVFARAKLRGAKFEGARLSLANMAECDATGADFTGADMKGADLTDAVLRRARLHRADLGIQIINLPDGSTREWPVRAVGAIFAEADLTDARTEGLVVQGQGSSGG